ncbi:MAG: hypothetical protein ABIH86_04580 [Planctomycetota bacterium]
MTVKNIVPAFAWAIVAAFLLMLILMTYVLFRDGAPDGNSAVFIEVLFGAFWLGGIAAAAHCFSHPILDFTADGDGIRVVLRYPWKTVRLRYSFGDINESMVFETKDSEGDMYYLARIWFKDGREIDLAEGNDRARCDKVLSEFRRIAGEVGDQGTRE